LAELLKAHDHAQALQRDVWQFALEVRWLAAAGLSVSGLRWLLCRGYAEHGRERFRSRGGNRRSFVSLSTLALPRSTCVVLTAAGIVLARSLAGNRASGPRSDLEAAVPRVPFWDDGNRELWCGDLLVKRFKRPAENQELILCSFQELECVRRIDDPLPGEDGIEPRRRLHETINHLNERHLHPVLRFGGDGTGTGVRWDWLPGTAA
jgi:hypothetical protein